MGSFVWYSKGSKESGALLAEELELEHGTVPPKDFSGTLICWGAKPADKFKWENRTIQAIFNDPRIVREYIDRKDIFDKLAEEGINVISCLSITDEAQYVNICNLMGATIEEGFVVAKPSGVGARAVTSQSELEEAVADGCTRAFEAKFIRSERIRLFVVNGSVAGAATRSAAGASDAFFTRASEEVASKLEGVMGHADMVEKALRAAVGNDIVSVAKSYWSPFGAVTMAQRTAGINAAKALGFEFCAVDIVVTDGGVQVINVVTTPNLYEVPSVKAAIVNGIDSWNKNNSRTAKEILQDLVNDATDDEADSLLEKLRELKCELSETAAG